MWAPVLTQTPPTATQPRPTPTTAPPTTPRPAHLIHDRAHQPTDPAPTHLLLARVQPAPPQAPPKPRLLLSSSVHIHTLASCWLASRLIPPMTPSLPGSGHLEGGSLCAGGSEAELRCRWRCLRLFRVSAALPRGGGGNLEPWLSGSCIAWQGLEADLRDACPRTPCCECRVS